MRLDPKTLGGFMTWAWIGFSGALLALLIAQFVPQIIPARALTSKPGV